MAHGDTQAAQAHGDGATGMGSGPVTSVWMLVTRVSQGIVPEPPDVDDANAGLAARKAAAATAILAGLAV
ncbi:MAG: hypothetical protein WA840_15350 [Caulobacteraceae bacterium]